MTRFSLLTMLLFAFAFLTPPANARESMSLVTIRNDNNETVFFGTRSRENEILFFNQRTTSTSLPLNPGESIHLSVQEGRHLIRWLEDSKTGKLNIAPDIHASITIVRDDRGRLTALLREDDRIVRNHTFPDTQLVHHTQTVYLDPTVYHDPPAPARNEGTLLLRNVTGIEFDVVVNEEGRSVHIYQQYRRRTHHLESRIMEVPLRTGGYRLYFDGERRGMFFTIFRHDITEISFHRVSGSRTEVNVEGRRRNFRFRQMTWTLPHPVQRDRRGSDDPRDHHRQGGRTPTTLQTPPFGGTPVHLIAPITGHPAIILYPPDRRYPAGRTLMQQGRRHNDSGTLAIYGPMYGQSAMVVQPMMGGHPGFLVLPPRSGSYHDGRRGVPFFERNSSSGESSTRLNFSNLLDLFGTIAGD